MSSKPDIVAFDLGLQTGWCRITEVGLQFGSWKLEHCSGTAEYALSFSRLLDDLQTSLDTDNTQVIWERTFAQGHAARILCGLDLIVQMWCTTNQLPYEWVTPTRWKAKLLGKSHASQREYFDYVSQFAPVQNADEAAAVCVGLYGAQLYGYGKDTIGLLERAQRA